jgi:hypothetical protein
MCGDISMVLASTFLSPQHPDYAGERHLRTFAMMTPREIVSFVSIGSLVLVTCMGIGAGIVFYLSAPRTESERAARASGLYVRIDPQTGCEYLVARFSGITPRLGPDRQPICRQQIASQ